MYTKLFKVLVVLCAMLSFLLLPATAKRALAASVVTYPQIPGMSVSGNFAVSVNGQNSPAYDASGSPVPTYTTFSTDSAVTVDVQDLQGSVSSAVVRPTSYGITPAIKNGNTVEFTMNSLQKVSVEVNGDSTSHVALIFADPLETNVPTGSNVVAYTTPGVYNLPSNPWCFPGGTNTLYIAGGVYLKGVISCNGVSHMSILGRGIFSGEGYTVPQYTSNIEFLNSDHTTVDGPTFVNWSPDSDGSSGYGFILDDGYSNPAPSYNLINDVALINDPGTINHSGFHSIGNNSTVQNSFALSGDDDVIISDTENNSTFKNLVLWTTWGNAIQLGWNGGGSGNTLDGADIIHFGGGNYAGTQAAIGAVAYCNTAAYPIHDVTVENVRVEGPLVRLFGLAAQNAGFCGVNPTAAAIYNITFKNISAQQNGSDSNVIFGSNSNATVHDVFFDNLTIGGQQINSASQGNFSIGQYTSNIQFNGNSGSTGSFSSSFESGQPQPTWNSTVDGGGLPAGGSNNITGICCGLSGSETGVRNETAHTGSSALLYSGKATNGSGPDYAYMKIFDFSSQPLAVGSNTVLDYWIYPQHNDPNVSGTNSSCVAIDLIFSDNSNLRDSGATDQNGNRVHPAYQCGHLQMDSWNHVVVNLGSFKNGTSIVRLDVGYDQPNSTGGYRGYIDDISIHN